MDCVQCGAPLGATAACVRCGTPRSGEPIDYPRDWPDAPTDITPPVQTAELLAYADEPGETWGDGSPRDYYVPNWRPILEGRSSCAGFNKAAFICGINWCFWRRLYMAGLLLLLAELSAGFLIGLAIVIGTGIQDPTDPRLAYSGWLGLLAVRLAFGLFANRLYLRRAIGAVARARAGEPNSSERTALLRRQGGTSGWGLAIALLLSIATNVLPFLPRGAAA